MLENAVRICEAKFGTLFRYDGTAFHVAAEVDTPPEYAKFLKERGSFRPIAGSLLDRLMRTKTMAVTADYAAENVPGPPAKLAGARSTIDVPMLKDDQMVGFISIFRQEVRPFTDRQIELVQNFAAQAVIAIENARLLSELRQRTDDLAESLEQQTATSEVLQIISSSPGELEPVFHAMLHNAISMCEAKFGILYRHDGNRFMMAAHIGASPRLVALMRGAFKPHPDTVLGHILATKEIVAIADAREERGYREGNPVMVAQRSRRTARAVSWACRC